MTKLECQTHMPNGTVTVGEMFTLACKGDIPAPLQEPVRIIFPEPAKQKHNLKIARIVKNEGGELVFDVYGHKTGKFEDQKFTLSDGHNAFAVEGVSWQVESVLQQGDEMNPPFPPLGLRYPVWIWIGLLIALLAAVVTGIALYRRRREREQLILYVLGEGREQIPFRELVKMQNTQAYNQFHRDLRQINKKLAQNTGKGSHEENMKAKEIWQELDKAFRYYLVRELLTPAFSWSRRRLLADIKKHHRWVYDVNRRDLGRILQELEKGNEQAVTMRDCEQVFQLARSVGEKIYEARRGAKERP